MPPESLTISETSETSRIETFCDGVFAIAITLLILEINIPPLSSIQSESELRKALLENWPSWFGFLLSFAIILISWVNHHFAFKLIYKVTPQFIYANGFMLLTVVVIPFTTADVGVSEHGVSTNGSQRLLLCPAAAQYLLDPLGLDCYTSSFAGSR